MTCSFCNSFLEGNETECPYCGHKLAKAAAPAVDPAEELTDKFAAEAPAEEPVKRDSAKGKKAAAFGASLREAAKKAADATAKKTDKAEKAGKEPSKKKVSSGKKLELNPTVITMGGLIACLILCIISLISVAGVKKSLNSMNQDTLSLFYQLQNSNEQLNSKVSELERTIGSVNTTITESEAGKNITISKEPTDTATYLDRGSDSDTTQNVPIFTVYATGTNLEFTWQRLDTSTSTWIDITWDGESNNDTYGLHVYTDESKGYSELAAHGVTSAAYGTYRCHITDGTSSGYKNSAIVTLSERSKDA